MNRHTDEQRASFYALPGSPHLTHSWCNYTLIALQGLVPNDITTDKVTRITVNGRLQQTRMLGKTTVMIYPKIKEEAQQVAVWYSVPEVAPEPFKPPAVPLVSPEASWGFTSINIPTARGS